VVEHHRETKRIRKKNLECEDPADGDIRRAEEEEEKRERRARFGRVAVETRTDQVVDRVGRASQGCVRLARLVEIEYDGSVVLCKSEYRESGCARVRRGKRIGIRLGCSRMFIHLDVEMDVE
jgi:hypothetical protein